MIVIDVTSDVPLVDQIATAIRVAIATGAVMPGAELSPVRQLANDLDVNMNTVSRAYRQLQQQGLVRAARGRGTVVTASREAPKVKRSVAVDRLRQAIRTALANAKLSGLDEEGARRLIDGELGRFWPNPSERTA